MSLTDRAKAHSITTRAKAMILHPRSEWDVIAGEPATVRQLFTSYVMYLAAIPPVCAFIGNLVFTASLWGQTHRSPIGLLIQAVLSYALSLASVYVMGLIIDALAPTFGGTRDRIQAMKLSAYFPTASWLAGVFGLIPALSPLEILGLYSLFVLWLGLPRLMKVAEDKALIYTLCIIACALVLWMIVAVIAGMAAMSTMGIGVL